MKSFLRSRAIILIFLFLIALIPRVYHLDQTTIYPDEISWIVRGKGLISALKQRNFKYFDAAWWTSTKENEAIALPLTLASGTSVVMFGQNQSKVSLNLFSDITAARIPVAAINALLIPIFYLLAKKFVSSKVAFLFAILLAFDPIHLALSRWVMLDGILTLFTFLAIYFFLLSYKNIRWVVLAGLSLAFAFLTKPLGLVPILSWAILSLNRSYLKNFFLAVLGFFFFIWIFWPGAWDKPILSVAEYLYRQTALGQKEYIVVLFMGQITSNPPIYYYLFQIITRIPSFIIIAFITSLILFIPKIQISIKFFKSHQFQISFVVFAAIYLLAISFTSLKLGARYALPLWPWIYLATTWGIDQILKNIKNRVINIAVFSVPLGISLLTLFAYFPDYYLFYNSIIGGPQNAQKYDLVGHCIGTRGALEYISSNYPTIKSVAILGCSNVTAPYYFNGKITTDWQTEKIVIVEYTLNQLVPKREEVRFFQNKQPIYEVKEHGAILSQVFFQNYEK